MGEEGACQRLLNRFHCVLEQCSMDVDICVAEERLSLMSWHLNVVEIL